MRKSSNLLEVIFFKLLNIWFKYYFNYFNSIKWLPKNFNKLRIMINPKKLKLWNTQKSMRKLMIAKVSSVMKFKKGTFLRFLLIRLLNSKVLIIHLNGCNSELAKNTILAGANISISDEELVTERDVETNFLFTKDDIGLRRGETGLKKLREINPLVKFELLPKINVELAHKCLVLKEKDHEFDIHFFDKYNIISTSTSCFKEMVYIDDLNDFIK